MRYRDCKPVWFRMLNMKVVFIILMVASCGFIFVSFFAVAYRKQYETRFIRIILYS